MTITPSQRARLEQIVLEGRDAWAELKRLELEAYAITGEEDKTGFTSDLLLNSKVDLNVVLEELGITVEDPNHG